MGQIVNYKDNQIRPSNRVDWSDPQLQKLLSKIEGWDLDNRESYPRKEVQIQVGWNAGVGKKAALVWKREKVMVLEVNFAIPTGEYVRVDTLFGRGCRGQSGKAPGRLRQRGKHLLVARVLMADLILE